MPSKATAEHHMPNEDPDKHEHEQGGAPESHIRHGQNQDELEPRTTPEDWARVQQAKVVEWQELQVPCWYREIARTSLVEAFGPGATFEEASYGFFRPRDSANRFVWYESEPNGHIRERMGGGTPWPETGSASRSGRVPVCLLRTFSRSELQSVAFPEKGFTYSPSDLGWREEDPTLFADDEGLSARLKNEFVGLDVSGEPSNEELVKLGEHLANDGAKPIRVVLLSSSDAHSRLRLERNPAILRSRNASPIPHGQGRWCLQLLADRVVGGWESFAGNPDQRMLVLATLTWIPVACLSSWVYEDTLKAVRAAVEREVGTLDGELPLLRADPKAGTKHYLDLWNEQRELFKPRLEALIEILSEREYPTYAEKSAIAAELHELMMAWGFRAISPKTGHPAYLRCHQQDDVNPNGCFQFRDINGTEPLAQPTPNARTTSVRLPVFLLTDAPPDRRREKRSDILEP